MADSRDNPSRFVVAMLRPEDGQYSSCPYVIESNHPRFTAGSRFDYGFLQIALAEGYTVLLVGNTIPAEAKHWKDGWLVDHWKDGKLVGQDEAAEGEEQC